MAAVAYPEFRPQTPPRHLTLVPPPLGPADGLTPVTTGPTTP